MKTLTSDFKKKSQYIPKYYEGTYNDQPVQIEYLYEKDPLTFNHAHVTMVQDASGVLQEFSSLHSRGKDKGELPSEEDAQKKAEEFIASLEKQRLNDLTFLEITEETRSWIKDNDKMTSIPVMVVKYRDNDGALSWVGLTYGGQVIEYERKSFRDYNDEHNTTERWINDIWMSNHLNELKEDN